MTYDMAFAINGKTPPQAIELEEAVLGALMLNEDALTNTIEVLRPEFFYKHEHQYIFQAIRNLFEKSKQVDMLTVVEQLRHDGFLDAAGGAYYVSQLTNRVASAAHIEAHARYLSEKYMQRELIRIATETLHDSYDETLDVLDLLDNTEQKLLEVSDKNLHSDYQSIADILPSAIDRIENAQENDSSLSGIPSGFTELDRRTAGFQPGTLIILAARPAMGKTAFALSMARNMAIDFKRPVAFFSLEMTAEELVMRLIASESQISSERLKKGEKLTVAEREGLMSKVEVLRTAPIYIDDTPQLSIFELRAKCRRLKQRYKIEMVFIDYLQLMHGGSDLSRNANREQEISMISRQLKSLSKELEIPVLALSQLSRAVETRGGSKRPQLSDLRESGAIEQDADIVMFIYRPEYYQMDEDEKGPTKDMADIILAKHRSGSIGDCRLRFIKELTRFENNEISYIGAGITPSSSFDQPQSFGGGRLIDSKMNSSLPPDDMFIDDNLPPF